MICHDKYGSHENIEFVKKIMEELLDIKFEGRDSSYWGEYYISRNDSDEVIRIIENLDPIDEEPIYPEFSDYPVLMHISFTKRSDAIYKLLDPTKLKRLTHEELPEKPKER